MMEEIGNVDEISQWIEIPASLSVGRVEERLRSKGLTLGSQPPSVLRRTVREWLEGPYAGRWVEGGRLASCVAALKVRLDSGAVFRTLPTPRSAAGPALPHIFLGSGGGRGEILSAVLRARRLVRRSVELAYEGPPAALAAWLRELCRGLRPPRGAEIVGGDPAILSLLFAADDELDAVRNEAASRSAESLGLRRTDTPGQLGSERDWESEAPSDAWENLLGAVPEGHRVWLGRIARESAVAVASALTGRYLPVLVAPTTDLDPLEERLTGLLLPH